MKRIVIFCLLLLIVFCPSCQSGNENVDSQAESTQEASLDVLSDSSGETTEESGIIDIEYVSPHLIEYKIVGTSRSRWDSSDYNQKKILITNMDEYNAFLGKYENGNAPIKNSQEINEAYFEEKAILMVDTSAGSGSIDIYIKNIRFYEGYLTVTIGYKCPEMQTCDIQNKVFQIEIDKKYTTHLQDIIIDSEFQHFATDFFNEYVSGTEIEASPTIYDGYFTDATQYGDTFDWLEICKNTEELKALLSKYTSTGNRNFKEAEDKYTDEFFGENILIALPYYEKYKDSSLDIQVDFKDDTLFFINKFTIPSEDEINKDYSKSILLFEIKRSEINDTCSFDQIIQYN